MENKILIMFASLMLVVFVLNVVSAGAPLDYEFKAWISGLKLAPDLTIGKVIKLCTQENCHIDRDSIWADRNGIPESVIIKSHYDSRVALRFYQTQREKSEINLEMSLPYELNETCIEKQESDEVDDGCSRTIPGDIDPETYDWKESIKVDLTYLKNIGLIDIEEEEIEEIYSVYITVKDTGETYSAYMTRPIRLHKCDGSWENGCGCGPGECGPTIISDSFPILPQEELGKIQDVQKPSDSNLIYWIIGIAVIVAVVSFFVFRKKK